MPIEQGGRGQLPHMHPIEGTGTHEYDQVLTRVVGDTEAEVTRWRRRACPLIGPGHEIGGRLAVEDGLVRALIAVRDAIDP